MEPILFAFILILVLILVLLRVYLKRGASEKIEGDDSPAPVKGTLSTAIAQEDQEKGKLSSGQETIYEYIQKEAIWICPDCDGENRPESQQCVICGYHQS